MNIRQKVFSLDHESVGEIYNWTGVVQWYLLHDYDQALVNLKRAIAIQEETLPSDSLDLARTYHNIAATYDLMGKDDLGSKYYNKSLKIRQAVLPPEHPLIAATYNNLGSLFMDKGDYPEALKFYQKSLAIKRRILPPGHPDMIRTENNIRLLEDKMKKIGLPDTR